MPWSARARASMTRSSRRSGRTIRNGRPMNEPLGSSVIGSSPAAVGKAERIDHAPPVRLTGPAALRWGARFARDPLVATRQCFERFGSFVMLSDAVPFVRPRGVAMLAVGEPLELWELARRLMRRLTVELLFGGAPEGYRIADLAGELMAGKW